MPNWKKVITSGSDAELNDLTLSGDISNTSGNFVLDVDGDIELNADGGQINMKDGAAASRFVFNLDTTPELDVNGAFTIDCNSDMSIDVHGGNLVLANNGTTYFDFGVDSTPEISTIGDLLIDPSGGNTSFDSHITASGNISASGDILTNGDFLNSQTIQMTNSSSVINTFSTGSHTACKYLLQVTSASHGQTSEMLVMLSGSTPVNTEYAQIGTGVNLGDFTTTLSGENVKLNFAGDFISCSVKFNRTLI